MFSFLLGSAITLTTAADQWAVLVAGSRSYANYRHQADVSHAYQIMKANGIPDSNIITMMYDDIATNPSNKFPGQVFNKPTAAGTPGVDVYNGMSLDYTGTDVTSKNFISVLTGNSAAVSGIGSGKVLQSGANDTVFINFDDHGGVGIICFPTENMYAKDLMSTLQTMHDTNMFGQLVFYMETCESGSMFADILPNDLNIYVTTAADPSESSWGTYCPPDDFINGIEMNTCLGDLYSVNWMEDVDANGVSESLQTQFETVQKLTTQSHVMQYGDLSFTSEPLSTFFGKKAVSSQPDVNHTARGSSSMVSSRDIPMHLKYYEYLRADDSSTSLEHRLHLAEELANELQHRVDMDIAFMKLAESIAATSAEAETLFYSSSPTGIACGPCCPAVIEGYEKTCGRFSDYSLKYARVLVNTCHYVQLRSNAAHPELVVLNAVQNICA
jgi:legumain